jgi:DNA-binding NarL/FixJ family response regulator
MAAALEAGGCDVVQEPGRAAAFVLEIGPDRVLETVDGILPELAGRPLVVVVDDSAAGDRALVRDLVGRGVRAVVPASRAEDALAVSVEATLAGQISLPADVGGAARPMLTVREKQVLAMVVLSFTNGEIAQKLYVSESTVKSHLSSAFAKLGVRSRSAAAEAILDPVNGLGTGILAIVGGEPTSGRADSAGARS